MEDDSDTTRSGSVILRYIMVLRNINVPIVTKFVTTGGLGRHMLTDQGMAAYTKPIHKAEMKYHMGIASAS